MMLEEVVPTVGRKVAHVGRSVRGRKDTAVVHAVPQAPRFFEFPDDSRHRLGQCLTDGDDQERQKDAERGAHC